MRKTTKQPVALAAVNKAWEAFYKVSKHDSEADLEKQGWKTARAIASETKSTIAATNSRLEIAINRTQIESKKARVMTKQGLREVNFFRPIVK
jgi:hypothetical protein